MKIDPYVLVLFFSAGGHTEKMALQVARGIDLIDGVESRIRTVPNIRDGVIQGEYLEDDGASFCDLDDLKDCSGLVLGSPTRFGNMAAPLKYFIDQTSSLWLNGTMIGKPAGIFTSTSSLHGGQETTLISMMLPLLHHGMLICGLPYSEPELMRTTSGGTPYGARHWSGHDGGTEITEAEKIMCRTLGSRVADLSHKLEC